MSNFCQSTAEIELPGESLLPKVHSIKSGQEYCDTLLYIISGNLFALGSLLLQWVMLCAQHNHYFIHIARFLPKMEIVQKHNTSARRLYIRGHNGKVYPYLVMNDGCLTESRREERVLQLFRMMNHLLGKQKVRSVSVNSYIIKSCLRLCNQSFKYKTVWANCDYCVLLP
jgi:phosphatidylinositol kinase/protein kinase (PI-3  family)